MTPVVSDSQLLSYAVRAVANTTGLDYEQAGTVVDAIIGEMLAVAWDEGYAAGAADEMRWCCGDKSTVTENPHRR